MSVEEAVAPVVVDEDNSTSLPKDCPICKKGFDKIVPKLLPCLHSFCQPCLEDQLNEQQETTENVQRVHKPRIFHVEVEMSQMWPRVFSSESWNLKV